MASFPPANICIYCNRDVIELNEALSDEHILPSSLGGLDVLPAASCKEHRDFTSCIERQVARNFFGATRAHLGVQSRHKKERQTIVEDGVLIEGKDASGTPRQIRVPFEEAPPIPLVVKMPHPNALKGLLPDAESRLTMTALPQAGNWLAILRKKYGWVTISQRSQSMDPIIFMRFLAKVAYAYAVATLRASNFEPWLVPTILGEYKTPSYLVGGFEPELGQRPEPLHFRFHADGSRQLVVVEISMRSLRFLPRYQVVCGAIRT